MRRLFVDTVLLHIRYCSSLCGVSTGISLAAKVAQPACCDLHVNGLQPACKCQNSCLGHADYFALLLLLSPQILQRLTPCISTACLGSRDWSWQALHRPQSLTACQSAWRPFIAISPPACTETSAGEHSSSWATDQAPRLLIYAVGLSNTASASIVHADKTVG
jgi:hypothetical protein